MKANTTFPITEVRRRIFEIAKEARKPGKYFTITENGKPTVVIMSVDEFESWQETMDVIREMPDLMKDIKRAEKDFKDKKTISFETVLRDWGYHKLADDYVTKISNSDRKKSSKRTK